jgi:hypothetical protein
MFSFLFGSPEISPGLPSNVRIDDDINAEQTTMYFQIAHDEIVFHTEARSS